MIYFIVFKSFNEKQNLLILSILSKHFNETAIILQSLAIHFFYLIYFRSNLSKCH